MTFLRSYNIKYNFLKNIRRDIKNARSFRIGTFKEEKIKIEIKQTKKDSDKAKNENIDSEKKSKIIICVIFVSKEIDFFILFTLGRTPRSPLQGA